MQCIVAPPLCLCLSPYRRCCACWSRRWARKKGREGEKRIKVGEFEHYLGNYLIINATERHLNWRYCARCVHSVSEDLKMSLKSVEYSKNFKLTEEPLILPHYPTAAYGHT
jgi:hypothetical protein